MTNTKPAVNNKSVSVSFKPKTEKFYIPPFKRNNKEKAYFTRLDKGKSSDVDADVSKPKAKPTVREHNKSVFVLLVTFVVLLVIVIVHIHICLIVLC